MNLALILFSLALLLAIWLPPLLVWFERAVPWRTRLWGCAILVLVPLVVQAVLGFFAGHAVSLRVDAGEMEPQEVRELFATLAMGSQILSALVVVVCWRLIVRRWRRLFR